MSVLKGLKDEALKLSGKALGKLLEDPQRAERVAAAAGAVQQGKRKLDQAQGQVLNAMGFAHRGDYKAIGKRLSAVRKRAQGILEKLERLERA